MNLADNDEHGTEVLYGKYLQFTGIMLEDYDAMEIAAIMVTQGLGLYRTCMTEEDYEKIVKSIYDKRNQVRTFDD